MENNNQTIQQQDKNYSSIWETNPKLKMLLGVLIFVFLGSGIGLAILAQVGQNYREKIYLETQSSIPKHKEPVEKYFTDQSNGYEIKYPSAWVLKQNPDESLELYPKDLYNANYPNDYVLRIEPQLSTSSVFEQGEKGGCKVFTNTFLAGLPAKMCEEVGLNLTSVYYRITEVSQTSWGKFNMVSFSLPTENLKLKSEYEKLLSQIKITNSQATWKTYRNEEYGFEFQYPANLYELRNEGALLTIQSTPLKLELGGRLSNDAGVYGNDFLTEGYKFLVYLAPNDLKIFNQEFKENDPDTIKTQLSIPNLKAVRYDYINQVSVGPKVLINNPNNLTQSIIMSYQGRCDNQTICVYEDLDSMLNQILKTFKFTK